ncbi:MAG: hypothetical protein JJT78_07735 [Leptospira sp.]|nr:hypothetical protein [Leptospira sp.]
MKILIIIFAIINFSLIAQELPEDMQSSEAILQTEKKLDENIVLINKRLTSHSKLLRMKVKILPARTVLYKGVANGNRCEFSKDQEAKENNCLHLEVYDFIASEQGLSNKGLGAKNKAMVLFFGGQVSEENDPRKIPPREINQIFSRIYMEDFRNGAKVISEVTDEAPGTDPLQNNNYFMFYQVDGYPFYGTEETPSEKGVGRYNLAVVENTKSHDIRNSFKKKFYVKHIDYFDKLYAKIYSFNNKGGNREYERNIRVLKESLKY